VAPGHRLSYLKKLNARLVREDVLYVQVRGEINGDRLGRRLKSELADVQALTEDTIRDDENADWLVAEKRSSIFGT